MGGRSAHDHRSVGSRCEHRPVSGFVIRDGAVFFELTWTKAGAWLARGCACPGEFEQFERYHLAPACIRVLTDTSTAVLACTWEGVTAPRRGAPQGVTQAASAPIFHALRRHLSRDEVVRLGENLPAETPLRDTAPATGPYGADQALS